MNTSTRVIFGSRSTSRSSARLSSRSTCSTHCAISSTVLDTGVDRDVDRIDQDAVRQLRDLRRHRRREHQVLTLARQRRDDAADRVDEAHVQHAIGLVEHEHLARRRSGACPCSIRSSSRPGRRHDDVDVAAQRLHLRPLPDAAEHDGALAGDVDAVVGEVVRDLRRRARAWASAPARAGPGPAGAAWRARRSQDRQRERGRLAGAGLRAAEHVAPGEQVRDRLRLDRRRLLVAGGGDRALELIDEAQRRERRDG